MRTLGMMVSKLAMGGVIIACTSFGSSARSERKPSEYLLRVAAIWKDDSSGSKGARNEIDVREFIDSLRDFVRWKSDVIGLLGPPNRIRSVTYPEYVASPDQAYTAIDYYMDPSCYGNNTPGADVTCCSIYFVTLPNQDSIIRIGMRCVD